MLFSTAGCAAFDNNKAACEEKVLFSSLNFFAAFFCEEKHDVKRQEKKLNRVAGKSRRTWTNGGA